MIKASQPFEIFYLMLICKKKSLYKVGNFSVELGRVLYIINFQTCFIYGKASKCLNETLAHDDHNRHLAIKNSQAQPPF